MSAALVLLAAVFVHGAAVAADSPTWDLARLMQELAAVKSSKGRFVERRYVGILTSPRESSGTLLYVAPDRLEKRTLSPRVESLLVERDELTIETEQPKRRRTIRLDEVPAVGVFVESIRSTLAGDLAALKRVFDISLDGDERQWRMVLKPTDTNMRELVSEVRIHGRGNSIGSIDYQEPNGDRSTMTITRDAP
ncbi:MAG TPA: LolA-related protein [Burkholderiales bacterium]|nr:LolA-related protein [Burkholderiales bacterium]